MIRTARLATALAVGVGLTGTSVALAQTQADNAAAQSVPAAATAPSTPPRMKLDFPPVKSWDPISQPTYAVDPPPDGPSGIYLPAVVLGYAKSAAGCVVIGCKDGPQVDGAASSASTVPTTGAGPSDPAGTVHDSRGPGAH